MPDCGGRASALERPGVLVPSLPPLDRPLPRRGSIPRHDALVDITFALLADSRSIENLFDLTRDIVFFVKNRRLRYVMVNQTLAARCGKDSKSEILGRTAFELFPSPLRDIYTEQDRAVVEEGLEIHHCLELHPYEGGRPGWCVTHKVPLRDAARQVLGVVGISRDLNQIDAGSSYTEIARASEYIQHHYSEPVRMGELVRLTGLSAARLNRLFKRVFHLSPVQLLAQARLDAATRGLLGSKASVTDVALACGYTDHSAFTRQFKATKGVTPSQYRREANAGGVEPVLPGAPADAGGKSGGIPSRWTE